MLAARLRAGHFSVHGVSDPGGDDCAGELGKVEKGSSRDGPVVLLRTAARGLAPSGARLEQRDAEGQG